MSSARRLDWSRDLIHRVSEWYVSSAKSGFATELTETTHRFLELAREQVETVLKQSMYFKKRGKQPVGTPGAMSDKDKTLLQLRYALRALCIDIIT